MSLDESDDVFEPRILSGLNNLGNTCYFNSGLQLLASATPFVSALTQVASTVVRGDDETGARHAGLHPFHSPSRAALLKSAVETLDDMQSGGQSSLAPTSLLRLFSKLNPQFEGMHQQDCPEMITSMLSQLEDEVKTEVYTTEVLKELSSSSPAASSSQRYMSVLGLVDEVHRANAEEEVEAQHKKGKLEYTAADYHPPRWVRSSVTDCFRGAALHTISCSKCSYTSRTVDEFTSLSLEIPSPHQRRAYVSRHPNVIRYDAEGNPLNDQSTKKSSGGYRWWNPVKYIAGVCTFVYSCIVGDDGLPYPLTLEECLDIHFDEEKLHGANKYRCPKCEQLVEATKRHSLLWCPEVLMIHLKRFEVGAYWTSKRHDPIIFPAGHASTKWSRPLDLKAFETTSLAGGPSPAYELTGVVNHHGSFGGGHYTAFAHKGAALGWVLCNDASVKRADAEVVVDSQEYLLMYRKQRPASNDENMSERSMAQLARKYLSNKPPVTSPNNEVMVQRSWLHRVATFVEPGPLLNRLCYCGGAKPALHYHGTVASAYQKVACSDYEQLSALYGGPPLDQMLSTQSVQQTLVDEVQWLRRQK